MNVLMPRRRQPSPPAPGPGRPGRAGASRAGRHAAGAVLAALLVILGSAPAGAHGGDGTLTVTDMTRTGDGSVAVVVRLVYVNDGHGVPDATVTAVVDGTTPVTLEAGPEAGDYQGTVDAPPGTTVRFTSIDPAATVEVEAPPALAAPTTAPPTTEGPGTTEAAEPSSTPPGTEPAPEGTDGGEGPTPTAAADGGGDDGGSSGLSGAALAGIAAAGLAVVGLGVAMVRRTRPDPGA